MLTFDMSKKYKGTGISNGLDRGLLVYQNGDLLLDEGMGLGAVAIQTAGMNYFASIRQINKSFDKIEALLSIDKLLLRTIYGIPSKPLTRFIEKICTNMYKEREQSQGAWFILGGWINYLLQIKVSFVEVAPKGKFVLNYHILPNEIRMDLSGSLVQHADNIFVMNELSGILFHDGIQDGVLTPPPSGWQLANRESQLFGQDRRLAFTSEELCTPEMLETQLYWGRESDKDHCWAGFIYELQTEATEFKHFSYTVRFLERG